MAASLRTWRYGSIVAALALALLGGAAVWAESGQLPGLGSNAAGIGSDPLTPAEMAEAAAQVGVQSLLEISSDRQKLTEAQAAAVWRPAGHEELLLIERNLGDKTDPARRADVFTYRYADDATLHAVYNFATGAVESWETLQGLQLPLTDYERKVVTGLALDDAAFLRYLDWSYIQLTGQPLTELNQVETRVFVYRAASAPSLAAPGMERCGVHRCAQIMVLLEEGVVLDVLPLINLSTGAVAVARPPGRDAAPHVHPEAQP